MSAKWWHDFQDIEDIYALVIRFSDGSVKYFRYISEGDWKEDNEDCIKNYTDEIRELWLEEEQLDPEDVEDEENEEGDEDENEDEEPHDPFNLAQNIPTLSPCDPPLEYIMDAIQFLDQIGLPHDSTDEEYERVFQEDLDSWEYYNKFRVLWPYLEKVLEFYFQNISLALKKVEGEQDDYFLCVTMHEDQDTSQAFYCPVNFVEREMVLNGVFSPLYGEDANKSYVDVSSEELLNFADKLSYTPDQVKCEYFNSIGEDFRSSGNGLIICKQALTKADHLFDVSVNR